MKMSNKPIVSCPLPRKFKTSKEKRKKQREYMRKYRQKYPEKVRETRRKSWEKNKKKYKARKKIYEERRNRIIREKVLNHYGAECVCCGENRIEFLTIDHIDGGGNKHRKRVNQNFYFWLLKNNFPNGYRVLCMNCNHSLGQYGYCPHKRATMR